MNEIITPDEYAREFVKTWHDVLNRADTAYRAELLRRADELARTGRITFMLPKRFQEAR